MPMAHHELGPFLLLNESDVALHHSPTPPSYWSIDVDVIQPTAPRRPTLIVLHALALLLAFFFALPVAIAMRAANHRARWLVMLAFYALIALGCAAGLLYSSVYPDMYEHNIHRPHGYLVLAAAAFLHLLDLLPILRRLLAYIRHSDKFVLSSFWSTVILGKHDTPPDSAPEYIGLITQEPDEIDNGAVGSPLKPATGFPPISESDTETIRWADDVRQRQHRPSHNYSQSSASEHTLFGSSRTCSEDSVQSSFSNDSPRRPLLARIAYFIFSAAERALVFAGYGMAITGIVVYTGGCRQNYINGCMAHLIKGSIFWCYGLFTFARFLGTFSELGWAWNRSPSPQYPSGEFVESLVIFLYGATNTWMERFGAHPGDPFTTKEIQHISIAVMFCFAGLVGMGIESKRIRKWLSFPSVFALRSHGYSHGIEEPSSYTASFNPFPALVIGVTGVAMSAHHQTYIFQVQIHALWGNLLLSFSVLRCFTYFFLWLGPPKSALPSRPPTEILASFFLACGGLVFMFSTEEVTFAAMRRGRDDVMMFLNLSVAVTCFAFCWVMAVVTFKGWIVSRSRPQITLWNLQAMAQA